MRRREFLYASAQLAAVAGVSDLANAQDRLQPRSPITETLRVHAKNPRYFRDASGQAVLLVGAHTWNNLVDMGRNDPPEAFDFAAYLGYLERYGHNFIRLWTWDSVTWDTRSNHGIGKDFVHHASPHPWARVGAEKAIDGKPKFDLEQFDPVYFERLRSRVQEAGNRGIYVSVMLFEGWGLMHGNQGRPAPAGWAWRGHPFHRDNNVNGIDVGDAENANQGKVHSKIDPQVNAIQAAYVRKVVDTVNDLDNVLYEVINEGGEQEWDWWVAETVREHERSKPKQHPIGITGHGAEDLASMLASPADWISPGSKDGFRNDPPAWDGKKVSLLDTDHVWGIGGNSAWVWKSFLRGHNPIFMDPYDGLVLGNLFAPQWQPVLRAMGHARRLSARIDLAAMTPRGELASTGYCLANPGLEYVVYLQQGKSASVDLSQAATKLTVEWIDCVTGESQSSDAVAGGASREFKSPLSTDSVLYLKRSSQNNK